MKQINTYFLIATLLGLHGLPYLLLRTDIFPDGVDSVQETILLILPLVSTMEMIQKNLHHFIVYVESKECLEIQYKEMDNSISSS